MPEEESLMLMPVIHRSSPSVELRGKKGGLTKKTVEKRTLRICLRAIFLTRGVQSDDLMSQNIIPSRDIGRNGDGGGEIIRHQLISRPVSRSCGPIDETRRVDFEPAETFLGDGSEFSLHSREVSDYGTVVRFRPGVLFMPSVVITIMMSDT